MSKIEVYSLVGRGYSSNVFLVKAEDDFLVDAGLNISNEVIDTAEKSGLDVDRIILTHRHADHVGDAEVLSEELEAPLFAPEKEAEALRAGDDRTIMGSNFGKKIPPLEVEDLEKNYSGFRVIDTPGHTAGSICLYHLDEKILFSGDTVFSQGSVGRTDLPTGDREELKKSVKRLSELDVRSLYPGHMSPVEKEGNDHIERALKHLRFL